MPTLFLVIVRLPSFQATVAGLDPDNMLPIRVCACKALHIFAMQAKETIAPHLGTIVDACILIAQQVRSRLVVIRCDVMLLPVVGLGRALRGRGSSGSLGPVEFGLVSFGGPLELALTRWLV